MTSGAEPGRAGLLRYISLRSVGLLPESVLDPVEPGQVGRGLGRGDDVIGGHPVLGQGQVHRHDLAAQPLQDGHGRANDPLHLFVQAQGEEFFGQADLETLDLPAQVRP